MVFMLSSIHAEESSVQSGVLFGLGGWLFAQGPGGQSGARSCNQFRI